MKTPDLDQLVAWYGDPAQNLPRKVTADMLSLVAELRNARTLVARLCKDPDPLQFSEDTCWYCYGRVHARDCAWALARELMVSR